MRTDSKIVILLATYNGEKYLQAQLDSLFNQSFDDFTIIARDDGSSDESVEILKQNNVTLINTGENLGAKLSFSTLLEYALEYTKAEYFMFCDQDDVWFPNKIELTINKMYSLEAKHPKTALLVHTDLEVVDEKLTPLAKSMWQYEAINPSHNSLNRLLMQNTITGCTTLINKTLATKAQPIPSDAHMHDWWLGLTATVFGKVAYLKTPTIHYRQHQHNDTGAKAYNAYNIVKKAYKLFNKDELYLTHLGWKLEQSRAFLEQYKDELKPREVKILHDFATLKKQGFFKKRLTILRHGLLKFGLLRNIGLLVRL